MSTKAEALHQIADECHAALVTDTGSFPTREVAIRFAREVRDLERLGEPWVEHFVESLVIEGAAKWLSDWRRTHRLKARTKKGTAVEPGHFAGRRSADGSYEQMPLLSMDLGALKAHAAKLAAQRNTLSIEIRFLRDLIEAMEADETLTTAGDAFRKMGLAA